LPTPHPAPGRRRIVKGAVGALPVVLTLASGSQAAAASLLCSAHEPTIEPVPRFTSTHDNWVRQRVLWGTHGNDEFFCVSTQYDQASGVCVNTSGNPLNSSHWVDEMGNNAFPNNGLQLANAQNPRYGLVYITPSGNATSLDKSTLTDPRALSGSCWMSLPNG
jgi:hypothetical protein